MPARKDSGLFDEQGDEDLATLHLEPVAVEAQPAAEAAEDLDIAAAEVVESEAELEQAVKDTGELYGVRVPHAGDPHLAAPEDQDAFEGAMRGETWLEALGEHATAMGPAPEEEVVVVDDSDHEHPRHRGHHATESGDPPVADKGAGGPGGM